MSAVSAAAAETDYDALLHNCRVATLTSNGSKFGALAGGEPTCMVGVKDGRISYVGRADTAVIASASADQTTAVHDLDGGWVTPALIDCHTHIVYGGDRCGEWELKLRGASYEEVAQAGGGIVNTVDGTRAATVEELVNGAPWGRGPP